MSVSSNFSFSIMTWHPHFNIDDDIKLIKSSLLYSDEIELINPLSSLYFSLHDPLDKKTNEEILNVLNNIMHYCEWCDLLFCEKSIPEFIKIKDYNEMKQLHNYIPELKDKLNYGNERILLIKLVNELQETLSTILGQKKCKSIKSLINSSKVNIYKYESDVFNEDAFIDEMNYKVLSSVGQSNTFPLLNEFTNNVVRNTIKENGGHLYDAFPKVLNMLDLLMKF